MKGIDERFLTRNGLAARQLAVLLLDHDEDTRLPRLRDLTKELGVGNGTIQAAFRLLEDAGAIKTVSRGHLGTFLIQADRGALWRLSGLGTLVAAMPLPYSRRYEGLATGLRAAFELAGAPFAVTFMRGGRTRVTALMDGKVDLAVLSRFAADDFMAEHPLELVADLGPATYVGAHGVLMRHGKQMSSPGLRVAIDRSSKDLELLSEHVFAGRDDVEWVATSYMQLRDLFARGEVDASVWNLDEISGRLGLEVDTLPLSEAINLELGRRNSRTAIIGRAEAARALQAIRRSLDLDTVRQVQDEVLRGERIPSY